MTLMLERWFKSQKVPSRDFYKQEEEGKRLKQPYYAMPKEIVGIHVRQAYKIQESALTNIDNEIDWANVIVTTSQTWM